MATADPQTFADDWGRAWNADDGEAGVVALHDDIVFPSPVAARVLPETGGVVRGKDALRHYWTTALALLPDLHFDVIGVYRGQSTIVINYRKHPGELLTKGAPSAGAASRVS